MSSITRPINPLSISQDQLVIDISKGIKLPFIKNKVIPKKVKPNNKRMIFTLRLPTLLPAASNPITVNVQPRAVPSDINSPVYCIGIHPFIESIIA